MEFTWNTDAAKGTIAASDADAAVAALVEQREWAEIDSARERRDIADGAFLLVRDDAGCIVVQRGNV